MATATKKLEIDSEQFRINKAFKKNWNSNPYFYLGLDHPKKMTSLTKMVEKGLSVKSAQKLASHFRVPASTFITIYIGMTMPTLTRRMQSGRLTVSESDRAVRYAQLLTLATGMMDGDENAALQWLNSSRPIFDNKSPIEHARTETGAEEVRNLIGRIEHGVWS